jgi:Nif-specific regulatory protein
MTQRPESGTTVRRFDLSQQFTAMQRISVVLSRATEISQTLQEVLCVLHNDAFMQHGMMCLYDSQQEILSIEACRRQTKHLIPGSSQIRYRPAKGWWDRAGPGPVAGAAARRRRSALSRRLSLYDYDLPFIAVR